MSHLLTLGDVAAILETSLPEGLDASTAVTGGSIDSRTIVRGELFFGLPGRHTNGEAYIADAIAKGASAAVASQHHCGSCVFHVDDPVAAMRRLARHVRKVSKATWIAVTGSVGKTTTRQLLASVLAEFGSVHQSPHNYNNHLGVPLTMLGVGSDHRFVIVELGTSQPGEIAQLGALVRPHVGVVTEIAACHLGGLGNVAGVAVEKLSLFNNLEPGGLAFLPASTAAVPEVRTILDSSNIELHEVRSAESYEVAETGSRVVCNNVSFKTRLLGRAMATLVPLVVNVVEHAAEWDETRIRAGLQNVAPISGRCCPVQCNGLTLIDDSYNASPASMRNGLDLLASYPTEVRKFAVLGPMRDLGPAAGNLHIELLRQIPPAIDVVLLYEQHERDWPTVGDGRICRFRTIEALVAAIRETATSGDVLLVKGSRSAQMERVFQAILQ